ncbi:uncharacterized protein LOC141901020 [Tubulanus polymorphus]|uniref:uncharacterized protein LOC141901020 n=1 Tax=Tubulanus polymorphus TaxID=672921 RepID=UPI003DA37DDF
MSFMFSLRRAVGRAIHQSDARRDNGSVQRASGSGFKFGSWRSTDDMIDDFHRAVKNNDFNLVEQLLEYGCEIDCVRPCGKATALMIAISESLTDMVQYLLRNGAAVNGQYSGSFTPLMLACLKGNQLFVHLLISSGANVNLPDSTNHTPLLIASEKGYDDLVKLLVEHGANINHQSGTGLPPLNLAWDTNFPIRGHGTDDHEIYDLYNRNTALMKACRENHLNVVQVLINKGANLQITSELGNTALLIACKMINACFSSGASSLREKCIDHGVHIVEELLAAGAVVSTSNCSGDTPYAIVLNQIRALEDLIVDPARKVYMLKNCIVVMTDLIKNGSAYSHGLNGDSLYKLLFECYLSLQEQDRAFRHCWKPLCKLYKTLALIGYLPSDSDLRFLSSGDLTDGYKNPLITWLRNLMIHGYSLKQLARIEIRKRLALPYVQNLKDNSLKLSVYLKDYIVMDAT